MGLATHCSPPALLATETQALSLTLDHWQVLTELKLGNGTSLLIFVNIVSALPTSIGQTMAKGQETGDSSGLALFALAFVAITMGIVYVQEAERKIPINYASRYKAGALQVRYGATESDGLIPNPRGVRVHVRTGSKRVAWNRRASRNGLVSDLAPEIANVAIRFSIAVCKRRVCSWASLMARRAKGLLGSTSARSSEGTLRAGRA
jgi:hypothetical protein